MNKINYYDWGKEKYPNFFNGVEGISTIGFMIEYLIEVHHVKDFEFIDLNIFQIYNLFHNEIEKRDNR
jgi:hypothetical protein